MVTTAFTLTPAVTDEGEGIEEVEGGRALGRGVMFCVIPVLPPTIGVDE